MFLFEPAIVFLERFVLRAQLRGLGWMESLVVCGSYAKGSLSPGWSDLDLVAVYRGRLDAERLIEAGLVVRPAGNPHTGR